LPRAESPSRSSRFAVNAANAPKGALLWRMCLAMFIATASFFLGQAKVLPESMRIFPLLAIPVVLVLILMFYWWVRVSFTRRIPQRA
jgi:hypothetical protein